MSWLGKRPVLAPHVLDVGHVDPDFFLHLARDRALEGLAVVHEPGHEGVAAGGPLRLAREQHAPGVAHEHDDGRMKVRVVLVRAAAAALAPLARDALGARAAAGAVTAGALPP
jgi:hypothetical protein